jgi:hypothetical protein
MFGEFHLHVSNILRVLNFSNVKHQKIQVLFIEGFFVTLNGVGNVVSQ